VDEAAPAKQYIDTPVETPVKKERSVPKLVRLWRILDLMQTPTKRSERERTVDRTTSRYLLSSHFE